MPNTGNSNTDTGKLIAQFSSITLTTLASYRSTFEQAASAAGVSSLEIAAPIAREINKFEVGDYSHYGLGSVIQPVGWVEPLRNPSHARVPRWVSLALSPG